MEEHSRKYLTSTQNCQGHQKQGKTEKLPQTKGSEGHMKTKCNVI